MNVVVEGARALPPAASSRRGGSFPTGDVEPVDDEDDGEDAAVTERALSLFRRLVDAAGGDVDDPEDDAGPLSFQIAARVDFGTSRSRS